MSKILDRLGVCASTVCLIHCLATPLAIFFFPSMKGFFSEEAHEVFAVIVISFIAMAIYPLCKRHTHKDIIAIAFAGVGLVLSAIIFEDAMPLIWHYVLTTIGSILLITAHLKNMKVRHGHCSH